MAFKVIHDRPICIGCGACAAVCPEFWEMAGDGKSDLKGGKKIGDTQVLELKEIKCNMEAAQSCPVNCIHIEENGTKKI
ncbi:TPA: ferredoxin [Candidatus Micrarchaeota archaeon]|nr:ferredoxin [Candidatus Micrarchaeota archaeon]